MLAFMGLLDVHMPLIYGERNNTFLRLQEEILHEMVTNPLLLDSRERKS